jgi:hypothetical protein
MQTRISWASGCRWRSCIGCTRTTFALLVIATSVSCTSEKARLDAEVKRLCALDGGVTIYETATLTPDKFNKHGQPKVPHGKDDGGFGFFYRSDQTHLAGSISQQAGDGAGLKKYTIQIVRTSDGTLMGEARYYGRHGGNLLEGLVHGQGFRCPAFEDWALEKGVFLHVTGK